MNIIEFIKPVGEVEFVYEDQTLLEALDKMEGPRFTSIPILKRDGGYAGTITEGDLLWFMRRKLDFQLKKADRVRVSDIPRHRDYEPVRLSANMDELIIKASNENFVPVLNENGKFVGIVTRKTILNYFFTHNFIVL